PEQADVAIESLDAVVGDIAGAAMDLHRAVGDAADHLAGIELAAGGERRDLLAVVGAGSGIEDHAARGIGLGTAVGEHGLNKLEFADRLAELTALPGIAQAVGDQSLCRTDADGGDMQAAAVEHLHGGLETAALDAADQRLARHAAVGEDD